MTEAYVDHVLACAYWPCETCEDLAARLVAVPSEKTEED